MERENAAEKVSRLREISSEKNVTNKNMREKAKTTKKQVVTSENEPKQIKTSKAE